MKQKSNLTILLSVVIMMFSLICGTAVAKPKAPVCGGLTGTWHGEQADDMVWLALHTSDSLDPAKGEMLMNWIDTSFLPDFSLTPGHGVWQLNSEGNYNYTWYAFAVDETNPLNTMTLRVSGVALFYNPLDPTKQLDCNTVYIYYEVAMSPPAGVGELGDDTFFPGPKGYAIQHRVPMVLTPLPE